MKKTYRIIKNGIGRFVVQYNYKGFFKFLSWQAHDNDGWHDFADAQRELERIRPSVIEVLYEDGK